MCFFRTLCAVQGITKDSRNSRSEFALQQTVKAICVWLHWSGRPCNVTAGQFCFGNRCTWFPWWQPATENGAVIVVLVILYNINRVSWRRRHCRDDSLLATEKDALNKYQLELYCPHARWFRSRDTSAMTFLTSLVRASARVVAAPQLRLLRFSCKRQAWVRFALLRHVSVRTSRKSFSFAVTAFCTSGSSVQANSLTTCTLKKNIYVFIFILFL